MKKFKNYDITENAESQFTHDSFKNTNLMMITGIKELNLSSAIKIAGSAKAERVVTAGVPSSNITSKCYLSQTSYRRKQTQTHKSYEVILLMICSVNIG